jgi:hypothetical protein
MGDMSLLGIVLLGVVENTDGVAVQMLPADTCAADVACAILRGNPSLPINSVGIVNPCLAAFVDTGHLDCRFNHPSDHAGACYTRGAPATWRSVHDPDCVLPAGKYHNAHFWNPRLDATPPRTDEDDGTTTTASRTVTFR